MKKEIIIIFLLLLVVGLFIGSPIYARYKINKFNKMMQEQEIARIKFIIQFPEKLKEYGYDGEIPEFLIHEDFIYLEDGKDESIMYKTDMELNKIDEFNISKTSTPQSVKFNEDGSKMWLDDVQYDLSTNWDVSTAILNKEGVEE